MEQKKYAVTVITPFHNVDMAMFRRGYESLLAQTIGFQNIEWIVVLHNTEEAYHEAVHELLSRHGNVILKRLDNDARTPSSPRNYGMKFATAPMLGFLDGDDSYTPECLATAMKQMQKDRSQMVVFRREYELEREGLLPLTEIVLWDQTQKEILIDRDHWDDEKMFSGIWGMVTSRLFDRAFLEQHGILFDETVPFTEDMLFLIEAYGKADRISYLPQFIGYRYFINSNSLVQSIARKDGRTLISYAEGFRTIFEAALRNGIYIEDFLSVDLMVFSDALAHAESLTLEDRQTIKEILAPYVHMIPMLKPNKLRSASEVKLRYELPREVILRPDKFGDGASLRNMWDGQEILLEILAANKDTDYGRRCHFQILQTIQGYQARVPVTRYDTYAPFVELATRVGESGIITREPVYCYLLTAGTTAAPRLIPATRTHLAPYLQAFSRMVSGRTTFLLYESLPQEVRYNDNAPLNTISGVVLSEFVHRERNNLHKRCARFTSPEALLFPPKAMDTMYLRLLFALKERDVEQIAALHTWSIVEAFDLLRKHWESLTQDIATGEVSVDNDMPPAFAAQMSALLGADPQRARELTAIFREYFASADGSDTKPAPPGRCAALQSTDTPIAKRIWPKLKRVIAAGMGSFRLYTKRLRRYIGDIPHHNGVFASSEAFYGYAARGGCYELDTKDIFYEFLPADGDATPLTLSQTQAGEIYEVIITNRSGLYRYATGDLLRIKENKRGKVTFTYVGRVGGAAQIGEARISEDQVYTALEDATQQEDIELVDFAFYAEERLEIFLESAEWEADGEAITAETCARLATAVDEKLRSLNPAYDAARREHTPPCHLLRSQPQTGLLYRDLLRFRQRTAPDQIKPAHFLDTPDKIKLYRTMVL